MSFFKKFSNDPGVKKRSEYQATKILGQGSQGTVKEALHTPTGKTVALKSVKKPHSIIKNEKVKQEALEIEKDVKKEIHVMQRLDHPHIIKLLETFETKDKYYMVSELATGGDLLERIANIGRFTEQHAAICMATILNAVLFLHDHGIVHRDLKPPNLLFQRNSDDSPLILVDFGVSREISAGEIMKTITGTPYFIAPEILRSKGYTEAVDLWSLGVICYTLMAGFNPFQEATDQQDLFTRILKADYEFASPEWDSISASARSFIRGLLTTNPTKRLTARDALQHPWIQTYVPRDYLDILYEINHRADPKMYPPKQPGAPPPRPIGSKMEAKLPPVTVKPAEPPRPAGVAPIKPEQPLPEAGVEAAATEMIVSTPTLKRYGNKVPGLLEVNQVIQPAADQPKQEDLPNLMDNIAKKRFKKAVNAILVARAMSSIASNRSNSDQDLARVDSTSSLNSSNASPSSYGQYLAPSDTTGSLPMPSDDTLRKASESLDDHFAHREITRSGTLNTEYGDASDQEAAHVADQLKDLSMRNSHQPGRST